MEKKFPKEQIEFLQSVQDMRDAQRSFDRQKTKFRLKIMQAREKKVDDLLRPWVTAGFIKTDVADPNPQINML